MRRRALSAGSVLLSLLAAPPPAPAANPPVIGTGQRTLVICVRFSDAATTRMANCSDWVTLLNNETDTFYNNATFNQTNFLFETISGAGAPANGWLNLGYAAASYEFYKTGQDAVNLADPFANFANYNRVLVITNWPDFGGQGGGPWGWHVNEGVEWTDMTGGLRAMTFSIVNEWHAHDFGLSVDEAGCVIDHELGHQLGAPTHYGGLNFPPDIGRDTITPWDIMGLSPTRNHFLGFPKNDRGWVPDSRTQTVGPPVGSSIDTTILLKPLETTTSAKQLIKIPLTGGANFVGYMVENRKKTNGDQDLPNEGVLITAVDRSPGTIIPAYVVDNPAAPGDLNSAALSVGQSYSDAAHNLTISNVSASGSDFNVRVQYGLPPSSRPDPMVTPWGAPPYETPDIWIDSPKNGWGTYHYHDGSGNPVGNGDDAWVNHDNRLYVRVHNVGPGIATNVKVQMFVNSPPGMGDAGPNWDYLGTIIFPSIAAAGGQAQSFVGWKPTVGEHTCVKAVIVDQPDELSHSNNVAQENVTAFDTSASSPYHPVVLKSIVYNPYDDRDLPIHINVRDVPFGWGVVVDKQDFVLAKGGKDDITVIVYPSGIPNCRDGKQPPPNENLRPGFVGRPTIEAQMPWGDTWIPIGGIDIWTHITTRTRLTCHIRGTKRAETKPTAPPPAYGGMPKPPAMVRGGKIEAGKAVKVDPTKIGEWTTMMPKTPPPPTVHEGVVAVEGDLSPASPKQPIAIELIHAGKSRLLHAVTDQNGHYIARTEVGANGLWRTQSFFAGDATLAEADSDICSFELAVKK